MADFELDWLLSPGERFYTDPPGFHIEGVLPDRGVCLVTGAPNVGKSTWALWLAYHLRGRLFARDADAQGWWGAKTLYIALEGQDQLLEAWRSFEESIPQQQVIDGIYRHRNHVVLASPRTFDITNLAHVEALKREAAASNAELSEVLHNGGMNDTIIVLDSLSAALRGHDENSAAVMSSAAAGLQHLAGGTWRDVEDRECGPGAESKHLVLVLHHPVKGGSEPRGSGALVAGVDCALHVTGRGDTLTVTNTRARGFTRGAVRTYKRRIESWCDLVEADSPDFTRVEFDDVTGAAAPAPIKAPTAPTEVRATTTPAPAHPADALRGLNAKVWRALALPAGGTLHADTAKTAALALPAFEALEARRRTSRWGQVLEAFEKRGLYAPERQQILNP